MTGEVRSVSTVIGVCSQAKALSEIKTLSTHSRAVLLNFPPPQNSSTFLKFAVLGCHNGVGYGHREQSCLEGSTKAGLVGWWERARCKREGGGGGEADVGSGGSRVRGCSSHS